jgi:hypothetical protein
MMSLACIHTPTPTTPSEFHSLFIFRLLSIKSLLTSYF